MIQLTASERNLEIIFQTGQATICLHTDLIPSHVSSKSCSAGDFVFFLKPLSSYSVGAVNCVVIQVQASRKKPAIPESSNHCLIPFHTSAILAFHEERVSQTPPRPLSYIQSLTPDLTSPHKLEKPSRTPSQPSEESLFHNRVKPSPILASISPRFISPISPKKSPKTPNRSTAILSNGFAKLMTDLIEFLAKFRTTLRMLNTPLSPFVIFESRLSALSAVPSQVFTRSTKSLNALVNAHMDSLENLPNTASQASLTAPPMEIRTSSNSMKLLIRTSRPSSAASII